MGLTQPARSQTLIDEVNTVVTVLATAQSQLGANVDINVGSCSFLPRVSAPSSNGFSYHNKLPTMSSPSATPSSPSSLPSSSSLSTSPFSAPSSLLFSRASTSCTFS